MSYDVVKHDMNRFDWEFDVEVDTLLNAATEKAHHHRDREKHWKEEFEKIKKELPDMIKMGGDETEFMVASSVSNYRPPHLQLDPEVSRRFQQAGQKIEEHRTKAAEYERWMRALQIRQDMDGKEAKTLSLRFNDVAFFGL
jgi:hypothetical protein